MKYAIIIGVILGIFMISLVGADYTAPVYTNVTIVLDAAYTAPVYTNVTIVLGETSGTASCWTKTGNILYIPNACVYQVNSGVTV